MENKVSITIPPAVLADIMAALAVLQEKLSPLLISLTVKDRERLVKMGEASKPFVEKVLEYMKSNPEFLPPYTDMAEMEKDWLVIIQLLPVYNVLSQIFSNLDDTLMELGSEVMGPANSYYKSVQSAAKLGIKNSKPIDDDLKVRYQRKPKRNTPE